MMVPLVMTMFLVQLSFVLGAKMSEASFPACLATIVILSCSSAVIERIRIYMEDL